MAKKNQVPPVGKVIKGNDGYGIIGKIGRKLFGKKTGWGENGGVDTGGRTKRNK
jgi:hypothetical protein